MKRARWEVCRGGIPNARHYWARFIAANGRQVVTTETYSRRVDAVGAIEVMAGNHVIKPTEARSVYPPPREWAACVFMRYGRTRSGPVTGYVEVRDVQEAS